MILDNEYKDKIEKQNRKKELEDDKAFLQYARQQFEKNKYNKGTNMEDYIQNIINRENHKCEEQSLDDDMIQIFDDNFLL